MLPISPHGAAFRRAMRPRHHCRPTMPARARTRDRSMAPPGGAGGLRARIRDGLHRWFRADGRAAETARLFRRRSCLRAMGAQRLHPGAGRADVDRRRACRSLRQGAHAGCGLYRLRPVIDRLRGSALDRVADRVPRGAGDFGGDPDAIEFWRSSARLIPRKNAAAPSACGPPLPRLPPPADRCSAAG